MFTESTLIQEAYAQNTRQPTARSQSRARESERRLSLEGAERELRVALAVLRGLLHAELDGPVARGRHLGAVELRVHGDRRPWAQLVGAASSISTGMHHDPPQPPLPSALFFFFMSQVNPRPLNRCGKGLRSARRQFWSQSEPAEQCDVTRV